MNDLLLKLSECVEFGKVERSSPFPPHLRDQDGASELTKMILDNNGSPEKILTEALIPAMDLVGKKFSENKIFVPQMLMSAKAMGASMFHLKPFFQSGEITRSGTFIIGTVRGDLHDIGKNLVSMMVEGSGWEVIDLGVDVGAQAIIDVLNDKRDAVVGLSALLTTTMVNMEEIISEIKKVHKETKIIIGGAPVNEEFQNKIGADFYSPNPSGAVDYLKELVA